MRVLHIIDTLWLGGAQTLLKTYFEKNRNNPDIFLYNLRRTSRCIHIDHANIINDPSTSRFNLLTLFRIINIIRVNKIEILHCHLLRSHFFGFLLKVFFFRNIHFIIHEHGDIIETPNLSLIIESLIKKKVDHYIVPSNFLKIRLANKIHAVTSKIHVIHNIIDTEKFNRKKITWSIGDERKKIGISKNAFVLGFAARLIKSKGWMYFVEAAKLFKEDESTQFIIGGDGRDRKKIINHLNKLKLSNVLYNGYISDMTMFYSLINCFVSPSNSESMGLTVLEAQAMGVPVIASNIEGHTEILTGNENALFFNLNELPELSLAIRKIKNDKNLYEYLSIRGIENANNYSFEKYSKELNLLYSKINT